MSMHLRQWPFLDQTQNMKRYLTSQDLQYTRTDIVATYRARPYVIVYHTAAGSLNMISPRVKATGRALHQTRRQAECDG